MDRKILIIRFGSLGDIILTSATVLNIKANYPKSQIVYLTKEKFRPIVEMIDGVDEIFTIKDDITTFSYFKFLTEIDSNYEIIFDLHGNFRSWLARKTITANEKVIYPKRRFERSLLVKNKIVPDEYPHTIDLYNQTLIELQKVAFHNRPVLKTQKNITPEIHDSIVAHKQIVVFAPGASNKTKQYPPEQFAKAAIELYEQLGAGIIWADADSTEEIPSILSRIPDSNFLRLSNLPIQVLASVLESAQLTIANDSGVAHLSSSVNTPVLVLFGPTHPALGFSPQGMFDQIIQVEEECRPCSLHGGKECYREEQFCFSRIESDRIVTLAKHKLEQSKLTEKAVFLDRDGTIIIDKDYLSDINEVELIEGTVEALKKLQDNGYKLIVVSNQSGVARGNFSAESVENVNRYLSEILASEGVLIDAFYYCPHHPKGSKLEYTGVCTCRKPSTGMVEEAVMQLQIDLRKSIVIGDKLSDLFLGRFMGGMSILVRTGYGEEEEKILAENKQNSDVIVCDSIKEAGDKILKDLK